MNEVGVGAVYVHLGDPLHDAKGGVLRGGGEFVHGQAAVLQNGDVGEGAANVNANHGSGHGVNLLRDFAGTARRSQ